MQTEEQIDRGRKMMTMMIKTIVIAGKQRAKEPRGVSPPQTAHMKVSNLAINDPPTVGWRESQNQIVHGTKQMVYKIKTRENTRAHRSHHVFWLSHYHPFFFFPFIITSPTIPTTFTFSRPHSPQLRSSSSQKANLKSSVRFKERETNCLGMIAFPATLAFDCQRSPPNLGKLTRTGH